MGVGTENDYTLLAQVIYEIFTKYDIAWEGYGQPFVEDIEMVLQREHSLARTLNPGAAVEIGNISTRRDESGKCVVYIKIGEIDDEGEDAGTP